MVETMIFRNDEGLISFSSNRQNPLRKSTVLPRAYKHRLARAQSMVRGTPRKWSPVPMVEATSE